jgi:hypothetical protein
LRPQIKISLKLKRYISKRTIVKFSLFLIVLGIAYLFDLYHKDNHVFTVVSESGEQARQTVTYFCNPVAVFSLKAPAQKVLQNKFVQFRMVKQLMILHSNRAFHLLKAEIPDLPELNLLQNLLAFRNYHYSSPGEQPPVS